jgi:hypothetical protein
MGAIEVAYLTFHSPSLLPIFPEEPFAALRRPERMKIAPGYASLPACHWQ